MSDEGDEGEGGGDIEEEEAAGEESRAEERRQQRLDRAQQGTRQLRQSEGQGQQRDEGTDGNDRPGFKGSRAAREVKRARDQGFKQRDRSVEKRTLWRNQCLLQAACGLSDCIQCLGQSNVSAAAGEDYDDDDGGGGGILRGAILISDNLPSTPP
ncbi:uncharacterized protein ARB_00068 [Trichophyton benhamiae CBS 112371]|uniref:Uncharacterized protein n=1 Tax=Arthroderma benhamiae (strain ATCC MYA-4681 / CBS 112371) TaxID=663331 RepID=D4AV59_ARTBC|nr:uncharacterized protein ARB_00068 [Trichophyton benhamiae CBS 112371]EFE32981.1 hypothetical protein ARB_00068 [Trichophyton benhamiae CBS 112371]